MNETTLIITGGTKGLGREISLIFAQNGHRVIALYSKDTIAAKELEKHGRKLKGDIFTKQFDISKLKTTNETLEFEKNIIGKIILINNAVSTFHPKPMHLTTSEEIQNQWEVTVQGTFFLSICLAKRMIKDNSGTIANILTPLIIEDNVKGFSSYLMAKHALHGLTKVQKSEFDRLGIRVLSIYPPFMETSLTNKWNKDILKKMKDKKGIPPKIIGKKVFSILNNIERDKCESIYNLF